MSAARFEWMLVSDLDGTLLGDAASLAEFQKLWELKARKHGCLVYASGRFITSMRQSVRETNLPEPDFWIGGVGTEIASADAQPIVDWNERIEEGWNRAVALEILGGWPGVVLQPDACMSPHKISGYWYDASADKLSKLTTVLLREGCKARVLYSSQRDVDILPAAANKGTSAAYVAHRLGLKPADVLCSGDSGNDADLFAMGFGGPILVGNATADLVVAAPGAYRARAGQAAGVIEGLRHYGRL